LPYLSRHIELFKDDFNELMDLADLLSGKGFDSQAMNYFNEAKKLKPGDSRLSVWLTNRGMIKEAIKMLDEQLEKDPENVKILSDAVHLLLNSGEKEKARSYLARLKRLSPSGPEVKKFEGRITEIEGNMKKALSFYEDTFRSDPKDLFIIKYLASIYLRDKMWDQAIHHFRLALENLPNEPFLLEGLGRLLILCPDSKLRNVEEGREYSERAYINYKSPFTTKISAGRNLATAYAILGDKQKASEYINLTINLANKGNVSRDYIPYFENLKRQYNIPN
jgi:tetratricopeptide (TPR) repeat protein